MMLNHELPGTDLHGICKHVALQQQVPSTFVCFLMFERLYSIKPDEAIIFLFDSDLATFLRKHKGRFEMKPVHNHILLKFEDGSTLAHKNADITWYEFFAHSYIDCSPKKVQELNRALWNTLSLDVQSRYQAPIIAM